jgi:hypothetical protein
LNTHRISTTISQKHWELLKKHAEKFETQQKALELALESLENSSKQSPELTRKRNIGCASGRQNHELLSKKLPLNH